MSDYEMRRIALSTGVELDVALAGAERAPPVILLHGFPESHRTWRHQITALSGHFRVIVPDQRGYAHSSKPEGVDAYSPDKIVGDVMALADALGVDRFALIGHDWGGAIAWMVALTHPDRVERLAIVNAPHPLVFQRTLIDDPAQRAASQYITAFRNPDFETVVDRIGVEQFFDTLFAKHCDAEKLHEERATYIDQWSQPGALTAMLNWYRASTILVPAMGENAERPAFLDAPFPVLRMPVLVIWGMKDTALLPVQLDGLDAHIADLSVVKLEGVGHFAPWEGADAVNAALLPFLAGNSDRASQPG